MALYVLRCIDHPGSADLRASVRPAHLTYLTRDGSPVRVAGALRDEADVPIGSVVVVDVANLAEAQLFAAQDPYAQAGLFASVEVAKWTIAIGGLVEPGQA